MNEIAKYRESKGYSQARLAEMIGSSQPQINRLENSQRKLSKEWAERLAPALGVSASILMFGERPKPERIRPIEGLRIEGQTKAGAFLDISLFDDDPDGYKTIPVATDARFPHARQYALLISGDSMNELVEDGAYVTCAEWAATGLEYRTGMVLHIERHQGHLVETTIKEFVELDGHRYLKPRSTNVKHQAILLNGDENTTIFIKGLVIGKWEPFHF